MKNDINEIFSEELRFTTPTSAIYYIEKYFKVYSHVHGEYVPMLLNPKEKEIIKSIEMNRFNLIKQSRQVGMTSLLNAYVAYLLAFSEKKEFVLLVSDRRESAENQLRDISRYLRQLPDSVVPSNWVQDSRNMIRLRRNSCKSLGSTNRAALCGISPSFIVMDNGAFYTNSEMYNALIISLNVGGRVVVSSCPNGTENIFYDLWFTNSMYKKHKYHWTQSRFNRDLTWTKEVGNTTEIIICEFDGYNISYYYNDMKRYVNDSNPNGFDILVKNGYKPTNVWYEDIARSIGPRAAYQELDGEFV